MSNFEFKSKSIQKLLPDHSQVAVEELDGDTPLLVVEHQYPCNEHGDVGPGGRMSNGAVQEKVEVVVLGCFGLECDIFWEF